MKKWILPGLCFLMLLVVGCPRNEYEVELVPCGNVIERKLTFYRADGVNTNGLPNYQQFDTNEFAAISKLYPAGSLTSVGERHTITGRFGPAMPKDIGGSGYYTNLTTTLGSTGCYAERFRGNDDLAGRWQKRIAAANKLADLLVGWSRMSLGREARYKDLHHFLDKDVRADLQNLSLYWWCGQLSTAYKPEANQEFIVRFGQYLAERGYFKPAQLPQLYRLAVDKDERPLWPLICRLIATKLGVPDNKPIPQSLAFLSDSTAALASLEKYLATTDAYRDKLRQWRSDRMRGAVGALRQAVGRVFTPGASNAAPASPWKAPAPPRPGEVMNDAVCDFLEFNLFDENDRLRVSLALASPPIFTNGKWDEKGKSIHWESSLEAPEKAIGLPMFCYASWGEPNELFQRQHFGEVILTGTNLLQYCFWRNGLNRSVAGEWDAYLAGLNPGTNWRTAMSSFRFANERTNQPAKSSEWVRQLFTE